MNVKYKNNGGEKHKKYISTTMATNRRDIGKWNYKNKQK